MRSYHDNKGYCCLLVTSLIANEISTSFVYIFPRTIAGGVFFFPHQKRVIIRAKAIIPGRRLFQILLSRIWILYFVLLLNWSALHQKIIASNKLEKRLLDCFKFGSLINFQCQHPWRQSLNRQWSVLLDKKGAAERGGMRAIIQERRLFQILPSKGSDYWKDAIHRRTGTLLKHCLWKNSGLQVLSSGSHTSKWHTLNNFKC